MPKFSLIVATLGRTAELTRLLESLLDQGESCEVIVVDQNRPGVLGPVIEAFDGRLSIKLVRSQPGLSRARNAGLLHATGEIIAFPDDDCWYPTGLLGGLGAIFEQGREYDGVTIRCLDPEGRPAASRSGGSSGPVTRWNVWYRGVSASMFFRRAVVESVGPFDDKMGLGSGTLLTSAEDIDYLVRIVRAGFRVHFEASLHVCHPSREVQPTAEWIERSRGQSTAVGYLLRKHGYPFGFVVLYWVAGLGRLLVALRPGGWGWLRFSLADLSGRWNGWWCYPGLNGRRDKD